MFMLDKLSVENLESRLADLEDSSSFNSETVIICNLLSEKLRFNQVNLTRSLAYSNKANSLAKELNDIQGQAYALAQTGHTLFHLDKFTKAEETLRRSVEMFEKTKNKRGLAFALNGLIWVLIDLGKFLEASKNITQVFDLILDLSDDREKIKVFDNISKLCFFLKNYDLPLEFHLEIISIKNSHLNYGRFYDHIGLLYFIKGENEKALENFEHAIFESKRNKDTYAIAKIYSNFASVYFRLSDNEKALAHIEKSNECMRQIGLEHTQIPALEDIINANLQMENYAIAETYIEELLEATNSGNNLYLKSKTQLKSAYVNFKLGKLEKALQILNKTWETFNHHPNDELQYKCQELFIQIYEKQGNPLAANQHFHVFGKYREAFLSNKMSVLQTLSVIKTRVTDMKHEEEMLKQKNVEIAKAYDELAVQNDEIHQSNADNNELLNRLRRLKRLLPICNDCKEFLNHPNYLEELEALFARQTDSYSSTFGCLSCNTVGKSVPKRNKASNGAMYV